MPGSYHQWARSAIAMTMRRWSRSGAGCRGSSLTASAGIRVSNSLLPSSSTSKSFTIASAGTRRLACLHPSSLKLDYDQPQQLEIKQSDSTKPSAPQSLRETQAYSWSYSTASSRRSAGAPECASMASAQVQRITHVIAHRGYEMVGLPRRLDP